MDKKLEIMKAHFPPAGTANPTIGQICNAMQSYADSQTKELREELERVKELYATFYKEQSTTEIFKNAQQ